MLTGRDVDVVDDIDLVLKPGEVVGLVGESGSGKTTVGTSLLGYSRAGALISSGKVLIEGRDVLLHALARGAAGARRGDRLRPAGPGLGAQPEHPDRQADRRAAHAARHRHGRVAAPGAPATAWPRWVCRTTTSS